MEEEGEEEEGEEEEESNLRKDQLSSKRSSRLKTKDAPFQCGP